MDILKGMGNNIEKSIQQNNDYKLPNFRKHTDISSISLSLSLSLSLSVSLTHTHIILIRLTADVSE
jgi:hypothetical protein